MSHVIARSPERQGRDLDTHLFSLFSYMLRKHGHRWRMIEEKSMPLRCGYVAKDTEDTLDSATNQGFNRQQNMEASQAKCSIQETHFRVF